MTATLKIVRIGQPTTTVDGLWIIHVYYRLDFNLEALAVTLKGTSSDDAIQNAMDWAQHNGCLIG